MLFPLFLINQQESCHYQKSLCYVFSSPDPRGRNPFGHQHQLIRTLGGADQKDRGLLGRKCTEKMQPRAQGLLGGQNGGRCREDSGDEVGKKCTDMTCPLVDTNFIFSYSIYRCKQSKIYKIHIHKRA